MSKLVVVEHERGHEIFIVRKKDFNDFVNTYFVDTKRDIKKYDLTVIPEKDVIYIKAHASAYSDLMEYSELQDLVSPKILKKLEEY